VDKSLNGGGIMITWKMTLLLCFISAGIGFVVASWLSAAAKSRRADQ
jgi:hypothetical protein